MKTRLFAFCLQLSGGLVTAFWSQQVHSQNSANPETNATGFEIAGVVDDTGFEYEYKGYRLVARVPFPETLPAAKDSGGHWGIPVDGLQMGLRFRRSEVVRGEPIRALAVLRNLTSSTRELLITNAPGYAFGVWFTAHDGKSDQALSLADGEINRFKEIDHSSPLYLEPTIPLPTPFIRLVPYRLRGKTEILIAPNLTKIYGISKPGEYSVRAEFPVFQSSNQPPAIYVQSDTVSFRIVEKLSPEGIAEKSAWDEQMAELQRHSDNERKGNGVGAE